MDSLPHGCDWPVLLLGGAPAARTECRALPWVRAAGTRWGRAFARRCFGGAHGVTRPTLDARRRNAVGTCFCPAMLRRRARSDAPYLGCTPQERGWDVLLPGGAPAARTE